jgi:PAP2 superfamily
VLATVATRRSLRIVGALYPAAMLLIIVGTGNHFIIDALLGGVVVVAGWLIARSLVETTPQTRPATLVASSSRA